MCYKHDAPHGKNGTMLYAALEKHETAVSVGAWDLAIRWKMWAEDVPKVQKKRRASDEGTG